MIPQISLRTPGDDDPEPFSRGSSWHPYRYDRLHQEDIQQSLPDGVLGFLKVVLQGLFGGVAGAFLHGFLQQQGNLI